MERWRSESEHAGEDLELYRRAVPGRCGPGRVDVSEAAVLFEGPGFQNAQFEGQVGRHPAAG